MTLKEEFKVILQSGIPLVVVNTTEITRATQELIKLLKEWNEALPSTNAENSLKQEGYTLGIWDVNNGWTCNGTVLKDTKDYSKALKEIFTDRTKAGIYILQNFNILWDDPSCVKRATITQDLINITKGGDIKKSDMNYKHLFFVGSIPTLPSEINNLFTWIDFSLPVKKDLIEVVTKYKDFVSSLKEKQIDEVADACLGMTTYETDNAIRSSIVIKKGKSIDLEFLYERKAETVRKSGLLEFVKVDETLDNVGGNENLKNWFTKISKVFREKEKADKYKLPFPKGCIISGLSGCLSGDTEISILRGKKIGGRKYCIKEAYNKFNNISIEDRFDIFHNRWGSSTKRKIGARNAWNSIMTTKTISLLDGNIVGFNSIDEIIFSGRKNLYKLTTDSNKTIKVTEEHPFKVPEGTKRMDADGFKQLTNLKEGDKIICRSPKGQGYIAKGRNLNRRIIYSIPYHPFGWSNIVNGFDYKRQSYARLVFEAKINNLPIETFIDIVKHYPLKAKSLRYLDSDAIVHHIDGNPSNDIISNLQIISKEEHDRLHVNPATFGHLGVREEVIKTIKRVGYQDTYDIIMKAPFHNYIANDFVVHNTGKTLCAKVISNLFGLPLFRSDIGRVFGGLVGETEKNARELFQLYDAVSPAVILLDEVEKAMAGTETGSSDAGVARRFMGNFLYYLQEKKSPSFFVATANDVRSLSPEFMRRFNSLWFIDLPDKDERESIFNIHIKKTGRNVEDFNVKELSRMTEGFTGAEIEGIIIESMYNAFYKDKEYTTADIKLVIKEQPMMIKTKYEEINALRNWAKGRAKIANLRSKVSEKAWFFDAEERTKIIVDSEEKI